MGCHHCPGGPVGLGDRADFTIRDFINHPYVSHWLALNANGLKSQKQRALIIVAGRPQLCFRPRRGAELSMCLCVLCKTKKNSGLRWRGERTGVSAPVIA